MQSHEETTPMRRIPLNVFIAGALSVLMVVMVSAFGLITYGHFQRTLLASMLSTLDSAVESLLAANPISNQFEIAAMNIEYDFGLKAEDVAAYKGVKSNDNGDAGLVLVVEAASGKAQDVVTALESYKQDQVAFYGNYAEFAQAQSNVENAIISSKGDRVVMVIASNACTADLNSAVDSALNS